jgi:histidinol-phosphate aminotransferase
MTVAKYVVAEHATCPSPAEGFSMPSFDPEKLLRPDLLGFPPYIASAVAIDDLEHIVKLDANENPYGPSPKALAALANTRHWNRYATQDELRPAIARYVGVDAAHIVVGNGADEMIDLIQRIFLDRDEAIVNCSPSFEMYGKYTLVNGVLVINVPRRGDFSIDVDAIERVMAQQAAKMIFVANPNNPDGGILTRAQIERLLMLPALVVLDEAYAEFGAESSVERVPTQPNLVVLRTFSKWAGLAGLRIGYCVAPQKIADQIMRTKSPYNVNMAAIVAVRASLEDQDYLLANVRRIIAERERLFAALMRVKFLQPLPSHANFILCRMIGCSAHNVRDALAARSILIRAFGMPRLRDFVRISVGTPEQDEVLVRALTEIEGLE